MFSVRRLVAPKLLSEGGSIFPGRGKLCPIENLLAPFRVSTMSADKMKEFQDEAEETAQTLKERAQEWQRNATDGMVNFAKTTDTYVHDNPW